VLLDNGFDPLDCLQSCDGGLGVIGQAFLDVDERGHGLSKIDPIAHVCDCGNRL
jgi:hypothetical protein